VNGISLRENFFSTISWTNKKNIVSP
jgi:hypothetical protein